MGLRPAYAFGCVLKFLLKPRAELLQRVHHTWHHMLFNTGPPQAPLLGPNATADGSNAAAPGGDALSLTGAPAAGADATAEASDPHALPLSHRHRGPRVVTVGLHIRAGDDLIWGGNDAKGGPKELNSSEVAMLLDWAKGWTHCAETIEHWWMPPPLEVRWVLVTNSLALKAALRAQYPGKVVVSDVVPRHVNSIATTDPESPATSAATTDPAASKGQAAYLDIVTEWLLLASCDTFVISKSGFSHSAVFFSQRPHMSYMADCCDPETTVSIRTIGRIWSGI
eukprot:TRINITY_DN29487_c0_g2_i1.p1 TRINITY_DN29487_c0_g2~~TRINITY_DN29487_c0_g2_i1.p1  ORF type:complete len:300 (-),score=-8.23 TRINITY_DN29487_c0_g2_i1:37-882(-)